jgi:tRNA G10  N-methylase Trm11
MPCNLPVSTSRLKLALRRPGLEEVFDAVVTDPPYGVRAGARKSVHMVYKARPAGRDHFPHTDPYTLGECLLDLLESAARLLRTGGRLVYFLPVGAVQPRNNTLACNILRHSARHYKLGPQSVVELVTWRS